MYELAGELLQAIADQGVTDIITLAAYVGETDNKITGAATDAGIAIAAQRRNAISRCSASEP